ncbi:MULTISPECIES: DUF5995 family protein [Sorangium]|uniref:Uncharacterized protein n=1 Tax=Sorangium cellulosum (strain So ce56) TaxID=448385 RepID=A9GPA5_SORC5|nr:DUF5995 family protein [Sorangium cellulosum]CAN96725.1 hypothetical protein predicted by Glimmer/Critica [Sorangium cellulosum So ce56]
MRCCIDGLNLHPTSVHDAAVALDTVTDRLLAAGDRRAAFTDVYGIVTRAVAAQVERRDGMFLEPAWISRLAGRFCERYLETLGWYDRGAAQDCGAWHIAYASTASRFTPPVQNALLGFSAHINYDLIFGIHATIVEFGHGADRAMLARLKHDHDQINSLLRASVIEALARLAARHGCPLSAFFLETAPEVAVWVSMEMLSRWRERVWDDVLALLAARGGSERAALSRGIERRSTRIAQMLALPSLHQAPHTALRLLSRAA